MAVDSAAPAQVRLKEPSGRWVLVAAVLGSGLAGIDATVVNVALPALGRDLNAGFSGLQWTINGYTLTLAALILLGGSLGDRYGRRRVFVVGVVWFALASALCALAPNIEVLIAARALQGIGGALLTPGSLAMISASFVPEDRAKAIGAWSGLGGIASAIGPFLGGYLVDGPGWRWIFLINLPLAVAVVLGAVRHVPESFDPGASRHVDVTGAVLGALGLGAVTDGLISWQDHGLASLPVLVPLVSGVVAMLAFGVREGTAQDPMLPLGIFASKLFSAANAVTFAVYAALGGVFFWLVLGLQVIVGFGPLEAGLSLLPMTVLMLLLSARAGALAAHVGPRWPMTVGPWLCAVAVALLTGLGPGSTYAADVLPPVVVFGLGLSLTVAPLTATVLAAVSDRHAGLASGVNNAVARVAGLLAVAVLPVVTGLSGDAYTSADQLAPTYRIALWCCAGMLAVGGLLAAALVRTPAGLQPRKDRSCPLNAPPLVDAARPRP